MNWLLKLVTGNPIVLLYIAGAIAAASAGLAGTAAWTVQSWRLDALQARYDGFVAQTKTAGEAAEAARLKDIDERKAISKRQEKDHAKRISTIDAKYRADLAAARVRNLNSGSGEAKPLSSAATVFDCPDRSADLAGRLENLEVGILGIANRGNLAIARTITCKEWIDEQVASSIRATGAETSVTPDH